MLLKSPGTGILSWQGGKVSLLFSTELLGHLITGPLLQHSDKKSDKSPEKPLGRPEGKSNS